MATLSASTSHRSQEAQQYQPEIQEGVYGDQNGTLEATLDGWKDIASVVSPSSLSMKQQGKG